MSQILELYVEELKGQLSAWREWARTSLSIQDCERMTDDEIKHMLSVRLQESINRMQRAIDLVETTLDELIFDIYSEPHLRQNHKDALGRVTECTYEVTRELKLAKRQLASSWQTAFKKVGTHAQAD